MNHSRGSRVGIAAAILLAGCAVGTDRVTLLDPMGPQPERWRASYVEAVADYQSPSPGPDAPGFVLTAIEDRRPDPSAVGVQKNGFGMEVGSVKLAEGTRLSELLARHLQSCFRRAGFELFLDPQQAGTPAGRVEVAIDALWTEFDPGFWTVAALSQAEIEVLIRPAEGQEPLLAETFEGHGEVRGLTVTRWKFEQSLNEAWAQALQALETALETDLASRLQGAGSPSP